jgi:tetratricopeptide (TPR) repeat protein
MMSWRTPKRRRKKLFLWTTRWPTPNRTLSGIFRARNAEFQRATQLNPNYSIAHQWYATFLGDMRRQQEAVAEIERAIKLDPVLVNVNTAVAWIFYFAHQFDRAQKQGQSALELDPNFYAAHNILG